MPNTKEKLIYLLNEADELVKELCGGLNDNHGNGPRADHLIANGVTVQKWISVKDRLPDRDDMVIAFYPTMRGTSGEMQIHKAWAMSETCTHWMPLPEPPKGE